MAEQDDLKPFPELFPGAIWAKVELLGHRVHYGAVAEATIYGATMLRVEVPTIEFGKMVSFETIYYGAAALYSVRKVTSEQVIEANTPYDQRHRKTEMIATTYDATTADEDDDDHG
jgi:hypothetical protein